MKKPLITTIIILLSFSLIGIIVLQGLWINSAWESSQRDFQRSVSEAMDKVVQQVELREAANYISQRYELSHQQEIGLSRQHEINESGGNTRSLLNEDIQITRQTDTADPGKGTAAPNQGIIFRYRTELGNNSQDEERFMLKADQLNRVFSEMVMELNCVNIPIDRRLPPAELFVLLNSELRKRGIDLPFQFGVVLGQNDSLCNVRSSAFTSSMVPASFRAALYPNDLFMSPYQLLLHFNDTRPYIVRSLWWMLILSAIFLLLIIATFASAIYIILKQKKVSEIKTDFINNMTHELKTPIATISIALDAINNPKVLTDSERVKFYTSVIGKENKRMNAHVEHILQMALVDKENFSLNEQLLNVHDIICYVADVVRMQVESRQGNLHLDLKAENAFVVADEIHLTNVIHNLLDNACKYSSGAPDITVTTEQAEGAMLISIEDKGIGMTPETQRRIFDKFYREQGGNIHNVKGFGLGLAYVRTIVRKHGGSVQVKSEPGKGSTFTLRLPYGHLQNS